MKITLYMAISVDGLITRGEKDSNWVSKTDWEQFYSYISSSDAIIMGRKTMDEFEDFPIVGPKNIVLSRNKALHKDTEGVLILEATPQDVMDYGRKQGWKKILLVGGSETNRSFLQAGLIDEIVLSVHPIVIGRGLRLFAEEDFNTKLELIKSKNINKELVQIKYKVLR